MRKKLSVYFDNEDEAMNAATKLRAAGAAILSVEEVDDDDPHDFLPINAAWLGGFQTTCPSLRIYFTRLKRSMRSLGFSMKAFRRRTIAGIKRKRWLDLRLGKKKWVKR